MDRAKAAKASTTQKNTTARMTEGTKGGERGEEQRMGGEAEKQRGESALKVGEEAEGQAEGESGEWNGECWGGRSGWLIASREQQGVVCWCCS